MMSVQAERRRRSRILGWRHRAILIGSITLAILVGGWAWRHPAEAARAHSSAYTYCAFRDSVFRDRHAFVGVTAADVLTGSSSYRACALGRMGRYHIGYFRYDMDWSGVEWQPGVFNFGGYDALMTQLALHHVAFLPVLMSTPSFHSTQPSSGDRRYPPQNPADFARFVALAVNRYKPGGTFWRSHPELRPDPIRAWQIWNEPSLVTFWEPKPNPVAYTRLLKAAYRAIKRADRNAEVVTAGLPWYAIGKFAKDYYKAMFRAGAGRYFDALAFHAYAPNAADAIARVQHVRQLLDSFGLRQKAIWLTEWGWAASGPRFPYVAYGQQVPYTQRFLRWVMRNRSLDRIERIFYFCWRDASPAPPSQDWWGRHMGMYRYDLTPKWVAGVVARFASRLDR